MDSLNVAMRRMLVFALVCALPATLAAPAQARRIHRLKLTTHVDPGHKFAKRRFRPAARTAALSTTWGCDETQVDRAPYLSNAPQIKVIYAYAAGATDNLTNVTDYGDLIQSDASAVEDKVAAESGNTKSVRFDVGGTGGTSDVCTNDASHRLDIQTFQLAHDAAYYETNTFQTITSELIAGLQPADPNQRVNYVVYLDNVHPANTGIAGQADFASSPSHGYDNPINQGRNGRGQLFALLYGLGGSDFVNGYGESDRRRAFLHELSHTLGAVQLNAPHSSGAAHCYDGGDIMCYDDGGPYFTNGGTMTYDCAGSLFTWPLDCNKDDYFNASPASGSYLANNWNEYDSVFLCPVSECDTQLPAFTASLSATRQDRQFVVTADTGGATIAHYEWNADTDPFFETDTGSTPTLTPTFAAPGTKTIAVRAVKADGSFAFATTSIALHEPVPSLAITGDRLVGATITLDGSGTSDPDSLIQHFRWDLDSNNTFETDSGLNPIVTTSYAQAGHKTAGLQIDYGFGWTQTFASLDILAPASPTLTPVGLTPVKTPAPPSISALNVRLAKLLKSGLPLVVKCNGPCSVQFTLSIDAKAAKRFHLKARHGKPLVIGRVRGQFIAGTIKPVLTLSSAARNALRKARSLKAKLTGSVDQTGVKALEVSKTLSFKR